MSKGLLVAICGLLAASAFAGTDIDLWEKPNPSHPPRFWAGDGTWFGEFLVDTAVVWAPGQGTMPAVAWGGGNWLAVWHDNVRSATGTVYAARVTPAGGLLDSAPIFLANGATNPAVAFDGTNFLVVWEKATGTDQYDIYGARVSPAGAVIDTGGGFPIVENPTSSQSFPAVSFGGGSFLVVWEDNRNTATTGSDIYGRLVTPAGTVGPEFVVANWLRDQTRPRLAYGDTIFCVAWQDQRTGRPAPFAGRVTRSGVLLDIYGIRLSDNNSQQIGPAVGFGGGNFLIAWARYDSAAQVNRLRGTRVTPAGTVLDSAGLVLAMSTTGEWGPAIDFDGTNFLITWMSRPMTGSDVCASRVTVQGELIDTVAIEVGRAPNVQEFPALAFSGSSYFVLWSDMRSPSYAVAIYGSRVTTDGLPLDSAGIRVSWGANAQGIPAAASDGTNYLVVWQDYRSDGEDSDIYGIRIDSLGRQLEPAAFPIVTRRGYQGEAQVAFDGTNWLVVWQDSRTAGSAIYGARVSRGGTVLDPDGQELFRTAGDYLRPAVAWNGTNYLVAWGDYATGGPPNIRYGRVRPDLTVLDSGGILVPYDTITVARSYCSVGSDGTNWLLAWTDGHDRNFSDVYATRIGPNGTALDSAGFPVSQALFYQYCPAVRFDGTNYLVAWTDRRSQQDTAIYAARVSPAGTVLEPNGILVSTGADFLTRAVSLVWNGTEWVLGWGRRGLIRGARLQPSGAVIDTFTIIRWGQAYYPNFAAGSRGQVLLSYTGWAEEYRGRHIGVSRIWGKFGPFPGVAEELVAELPGSIRVLPNPTTGPALIRTAQARRVAVYDALGRLVRRLELQKGQAQLTGLEPGVYLLWAEPGQAQAKLIVR